MGRCQNYGRYPKYSVPYYNKDPKRDPNFDNSPYIVPYEGRFSGSQLIILG